MNCKFLELQHKIEIIFKLDTRKAKLALHIVHIDFYLQNLLFDSFVSHYLVSVLAFVKVIHTVLNAFKHFSAAKFTNILDERWNIDHKSTKQNVLFSCSSSSCSIFSRRASRMDFFFGLDINLGTNLISCRELLMPFPWNWIRTQKGLKAAMRSQTSFHFRSSIKLSELR